MADYRLPMDADGVKYHGTVDQNEENPGHFMYGLDENGNKRIIRTDEQGNVLTKVTGSIVELNKGTYPPVNPLEIVGGTYINLLEINTYPFKEIRGVIRFSSSVNDVAIRLWYRINSSFSYYEHKDINGERLEFVFEPYATSYELRLENNGDDTIKLINFEVVGLLN